MYLFLGMDYRRHFRYIMNPAAASKVLKNNWSFKFNSSVQINKFTYLKSKEFLDSTAGNSAVNKNQRTPDKPELTSRKASPCSKSRVKKEKSNQEHNILKVFKYPVAFCKIVLWASRDQRRKPIGNRETMQVKKSALSQLATSFLGECVWHASNSCFLLRKNLDQEEIWGG